MREDLIAVDVLLETGPRMLAEATRWNAAMREQFPQGFRLDDEHTPHITLVQQFIARADLPRALAAVERVKAGFDVAGLQLRATGLYHVAIAGIGLAGIVVESSGPLIALQRSIIDAVGHLSRTGGGEAAFVPDTSGTAFDPLLFGFVETYVQRRAGERFNPHVTVGRAPLGWLQIVEAQPFEAFTFDVTGIATYQIGNFGTASRRLDRG
jgi:2'-5' RNA ligase